MQLFFYRPPGKPPKKKKKKEEKIYLGEMTTIYRTKHRSETVYK